MSRVAMKSDENSDEYDTQESDADAKMQATTATSPRMPTIQLLRSESLTQSKRLSEMHRAQKSQSLEMLTEQMSLDGKSNLASGFDPARWIVAAGFLEKRRDGRMREGWAKRFFVLGKHTLYYYLMPKTDTSGYTPLLGDERGQIKLADIQDVISGQDKDYFVLTMTVASVRKNNPSQYFGKDVSQVQLRIPSETGQLWMNAIVNARNATKGCNSPNRSMRKAPTDDSSRTIASYPSNATVTTLPGEHEPSSPITMLRPDPALHRDAHQVRYLDTIPLEESFPLSHSVPISPFLLGLLVLNAVCFAHYSRLQAQVPRWTSLIPGYVYGLANVIIIYFYWSLRGRNQDHDRIAREARFRIEVMRQEMKKQIGDDIDNDDDDEPISLTKPNHSEFVRFEEALTDEKHVAGTSTTLSTKPSMKPGCDFMMWYEAPGPSFKLRVGPNYKKTGAKAPSGDALYSCVGIDLLRSSDRIFNIASHKKIVIPAHRPDVGPTMESIRKAGIPRLFIINAQIPDKGPLMMGKAPDDPGYSLVFYFVVKAQTVNQFLECRDAKSPAAKLLYQYVHEHRTNADIRRRFKAIGMVENMKDIGFAGVGPLIDKFNGKPAIINKVAQIYDSGGDMDWFEVDISIYDFPFLAKKALSVVKDRVSELNLKAGFAIQGETDEELPECLLGGVDLCGLDFRLAKLI